jgi:hypothetical protein
MTIDESILLMTTLFYDEAGDLPTSMAKAERVMHKVIADPPHTHFATSIALAAAQLMVKRPARPEDDCIRDAKSLHAYIQMEGRARLNKILEQASANANGGNSQGKGGCGESPELGQGG